MCCIFMEKFDSINKLCKLKKKTENNQPNFHNFFLTKCFKELYKSNSYFDFYLSKNQKFFDIQQRKKLLQLMPYHHDITC